jgi:osmotically-inducible protein OsmY
MNDILVTAPRRVAGGAQTVVKLAKGDRKTRKRFSKNKGQIVRTAAVGGAGVATAVALGARRRRKALIGRTVGAVTRHEDLNDPALAAKVESEIFRDHDAPKGSVNVNSENGVIYLRGEVDTQEQIDSLGTAARKVSGVKEVKNLLHLPGDQAKTKD